MKIIIEFNEIIARICDFSLIRFVPYLLTVRYPYSIPYNTAHLPVHCALYTSVYDSMFTGSLHVHYSSSILQLLHKHLAYSSSVRNNHNSFVSDPFVSIILISGFSISESSCELVPLCDSCFVRQLVESSLSSSVLWPFLQRQALTVVTLHPITVIS